METKVTDVDPARSSERRFGKAGAAGDATGDGHATREVHLATREREGADPAAREKVFDWAASSVMVISAPVGRTSPRGPAAAAAASREAQRGRA